MAMRPRSTFFAALALAAIPLCLTAAGKKANTYLVTFHLEADKEDAPKFAVPIKLGSEKRQYYFSRVPEFTDDNILYFFPFIAENGASYGVAFKLKPTSAVGLKALSLKNQGKLLGARIPNAPYTAVQIDRPVDDGILVVWGGLSKAHLKAFAKHFPHVDQVRQALGQGAVSDTDLKVDLPGLE